MVGMVPWIVTNLNSIIASLVILCELRVLMYNMNISIFKDLGDLNKRNLSYLILHGFDYH
jgi:hypothetical protein